MTTTELEHDLRAVLNRQAEALEPPVWHPADGVLRTVVPLPGTAGRPGRGGRGGRALWMATAAAAAVLAVGALAALWPGRQLDTSPAASPDAAPFHVETSQVVLDAATVTVDVAGQRFTPIDDSVEVSGDPGTPDEYTTLELTWREHGVEMRVNLYFASDGTDWWVSEARTYDGRDPADWIIQEGQFLRTPLGAQYLGDVNLGRLHITDARLEPFRAPPGCEPARLGTNGGSTVSTVAADSAPPLRLLGASLAIELPIGASGYGFDVTLLDTRTCAVSPVAGSGLSIQATVANPSIYPGQVSVDGGRIELSNQGLTLRPGTTTLHVTATDPTGGQVDTIDVPIIIEQR